METTGRKRHTTTAPLLITFVLGAAIGFSAGYLYRSEIAVQPMPNSTAVVSPAPSSIEQMVETAKVYETTAPIEQAPASESVQPQPPAVQEQTTLATSEPPAPEPVPAPEPTPPPTPESVASAHLFVAVKGTVLEDAAKAMLAEIKPAGIVLVADNIESEQQTRDLIASIKEAVGLGSGLADRPLIAVDQEGGVVNRLMLETAPGAAELGAKRDAEAARACGVAFAEACKKRNIAVMLAPVLDVAEAGTESDQKRSFGSDGKLVTALGLAFADGVVSSGVISVAKHFPGHGTAKEDSHATLAVLDKEIPQLAQVMYPFSEAAAFDIPGIMVGHIAVPKLDKKEPNRPASLSPVLVQTLLRERWGYKGVILTDDVNMGAVTQMLRPPDAAVAALQVGNDVVVYLDPDPSAIRAVRDAIEGAVTAGVLSAERLAESKSRIESWQTWLNEPHGLTGTLPDVPVEPAATVEPAPPATPPAEEKPPSEPAPTDSPKAETPATTTTETTTTPPAEPAPTTSPAEQSVPPAPEPSKPEPVPQPTTETTPPQTSPATEPAAPPAPEPPKPEPTPQPPAQPEQQTEPPKTYTIEKGDTLSKISRKLNVKVNDLISWNALENETIKSGHKLIVSAPQPAPEQPALAPTATVEQPPAAPASQPENTVKREHTVEAGQTLSAIADEYGLAIEDLKMWNGLTSDEIQAGKVLTLYFPVAADASKPSE